MSQTLAPSPSAWTALLIALTNAEMLGQLGPGAGAESSLGSHQLQRVA